MNASLTHLGSLEVIRLDDQGLPRELDFIPLDDIRGIILASPTLFRGAKVFYDDGRDDEILLVPLIYGVSWSTNNEYYRSGRMTRFASFVNLDGRSIGIGYGQQDWKVPTEGGETLFGLRSVGEVMVALEVGDPRFELKCRARGLDPDVARSWRREGG